MGSKKSGANNLIFKIKNKVHKNFKKLKKILDFSDGFLLFFN